MRRSLLDTSVLTALCLALYLPGLVAIPPVDRDEARFAQATKQMIASRDFVRPRFQDTPRFNKPIGIYWLQSAAVLAAGPGRPAAIWPYRLPSVLGALIAVLLTYGAGRRLFGAPVGLLGAALLAASALLTVEAHLATTDAALLMCVVAAQLCLAELYAADRGGRRVPAWYAVVFWVAQGLGILIKGPIVPMVSALTALTLSVADWSRLRAGAILWLAALRCAWGVPLMLVIVLPWAIAVGIQTGGGFYGEAWRGDILPKLSGAHESHGGPPGYHVLLSLAAFWPGSLAAGLGVLHAWARRAHTGERFCLAWLVPAWVAFEIAPTKLPHYVLPMYPALALLTAAAAHAAAAGALPAARSAAARVGFRVWGGVTLAVVAIALAGAVSLGRSVASATALPLLTAAVIAVIGVRLCARAQLVRGAWMATIAAVLLVAPCLQWIVPNLERLWLSRAAARAINDRVRAADAAPPVAAVGYHEPSLIFLTDGAVVLTDADGAAAFLQAHPDGLVIVASDQWERSQQAAATAGIPTRAVWSGDGINYSKGRWTRLHLMERRHAPASVN